VSGRRLFPLVLVVLAVLTWWSFERMQQRLRANLILNMAEIQGGQIAAREGAVGPELRPLIATTIQGLRQAVADAPADSRIPLAIGSHYLMLGNVTEAAEWYRRALELEPRPEIYLNLGRAAWAAGDRDAAIEHFRSAVLIEAGLRRSVPPALREEMPEPPQRRQSG
jgi:tetratricopeptide (TPR) repeat protein